MSRRLRAGLSGLGGISAVTLEAARRSPDFVITAIQDVDPAALRRAGDRFGIARRHRRFEDLLREDLDFVILDTPNHLHAAQARLAARAGRHCLVQKPMARAAREAAAMVAAFRRRRLRLGVAMLELGDPVHHQIREMVRSGWLGEPVLVEATNAHALYRDAPPPRGDWRRDHRKVGGAAFTQLAVHDINLTRWILGRRVTRVAAVRSRGRTVFTEDSVAAAVLFSGGAAGSFLASYAAAGKSLTILGTRGRIHLLPEHLVLQGEGRYRGALLAYDAPGRERVIPLAAIGPAARAPAPPTGRARRLARALEVHGRFARSLAGRDEYPCSGEEGVSDLLVLDAVRRSLERGEGVRVR